jgi:putative endonuclease
VWYVYFLRLKNADVYVGFARDLKQRFALHQAGKVKSTSPHIPATLISYVAVETEVGARALEQYFKSGSGNAFAKKRFWS